MKVTSMLRGRLSPSSFGRLRQARDRMIAWTRGSDLIRLGKFFDTDKGDGHWYLQHYDTHFRPLRRRHLNILEIGVGGYSDPNLGGASLRMWKAYFPKAHIFGLDVFDKRNLEENRIKIFQGSQVEEAVLRTIVDRMGGVDIVIDDGSHINKHVIRTFEILFPLLRKDGIYAIEDTQTSYWPGFGGSSRDLRDRSTIMGYFTPLVHSLNYEEILKDTCAPSYLDRHVVAVHFYHNLIFIRKGDNLEGSHYVH